MARGHRCRHLHRATGAELRGRVGRPHRRAMGRACAADRDQPHDAGDVAHGPFPGSRGAGHRARAIVQAAHERHGADRRRAPRLGGPRRGMDRTGFPFVGRRRPHGLRPVPAHAGRRGEPGMGGHRSGHAGRDSGDRAQQPPRDRFSRIRLFGARLRAGADRRPHHGRPDHHRRDGHADRAVPG
ncbi:hypothetical protein G6F57_020612 [Rhizopus arrhizus]|nr:hypothetical protein G6F57_020612 [Rhizopus arrhizus]